MQILRVLVIVCHCLDLFVIVRYSNHIFAMLCYAIVISKFISYDEEMSENKKTKNEHEHMTNDDKSQINPRLPKKWIEMLDEYAKQHNLQAETRQQPR